MNLHEKSCGLLNEMFPDISQMNHHGRSTNNPRKEHVNQRKTLSMRDYCAVYTQFISDLCVDYVILT